MSCSGCHWRLVRQCLRAFNIDYTRAGKPPRPVRFLFSYPSSCLGTHFSKLPLRGSHPPAADSTCRRGEADLRGVAGRASLSRGRSLGPTENRSPNGSDSNRLVTPQVAHENRATPVAGRPAGCEIRLNRAVGGSDLEYALKIVNRSKSNAAAGTTRLNGDSLTTSSRRMAGLAVPGPRGRCV